MLMLVYRVLNSGDSCGVHKKRLIMAQNSMEKHKKLHDIVNASSQDMNEMQTNLSKLKSLSEDDKTENAKLRSRIDEQSQLIMVLKQRADEGIIRSMTLEKINKELTDFRDQADVMLKNEIRKSNTLDTRFNNLASNHEEMIRIKDEYKRVNQDLREENARLKEENSKMFSKATAEKDQVIYDLDKRCSSLQEKSLSLEQKLRQVQSEGRSKEDSLRKQIQELQTTSNEQIKSLQKKIQDTEEKLKGSEYKLSIQLDRKQSIESENSMKFQQLTKEKDELLTLVMQRGKIVQKEQENNKILQKKIEEMEKSVREMEEKFIRESEAVNANLKVRRLNEDLKDAHYQHSELTKEFEAFKKHSADLLRKEKELNDKLRNLYG